MLLALSCFLKKKVKGTFYARHEAFEQTFGKIRLLLSAEISFS